MGPWVGVLGDRGQMGRRAPSPRDVYLSVQRMAEQPRVLPDPAAPHPCSHLGAAHHARAWCWPGPCGQLSPWAVQAGPDPGRGAHLLPLAARCRRAWGQPHTGRGPAVRRHRDPAWPSHLGAGVWCPGSQTATKPQPWSAPTVHPSTGRRGCERILALPRTLW